MKAKREVRDYLDDIIEAIENIQDFTKGITQATFAKDQKTLYAVVRALEIIGEASKKIPSSVKTRYPKTPWKRMTGMRDKLIHDYFGVNTRVVWKTLQEDIPPLLPKLKKILNILEEKK